MTELTDKIKGLGDRLLGIDSGMDVVQQIKDGNADGKTVLANTRKFGDLIDEFGGLIITSMKTKSGSEHALREGDYSAYIALSLFEHDLFHLAFQINSYYSIMTEIFANEKPDIPGNDKLMEVVYMHDALRYSILLSPYLATGDKKYLASIPVNHAPSLLAAIVNESFNPNYSFGDATHVSSDEYFAAAQLVKNANRKFREAVKDGIISSDISDMIDIQYKRDADQTVVSVSDNGPGIAPDKLPLLFGTYTEGGTGIGLQIVKRIADLRQGNIEVISTTPNGDTFRYDTKTGNVDKIEGKQSHGTTFRIYLPIKQIL